MTREAIVSSATDYVESTEHNCIATEYALDSSLVGVRMYDAPVIRFGSAVDPLFEQLRQEEAVGPHFCLPRWWLADAQTVISLFLPVSQAVRRGNRTNMRWPSDGWLHARIEGQAMIGHLNTYLCELLEEAGYAAVAPSMDERLQVNEGRDSNIPKYSSSWSERHVAFVAGLGTFGLSKGLISHRGVAGRYTSIVTNFHTVHDQRPYRDLYEYCSMCGVCVRNCPVQAISLKTGKDHQRCSNFLDSTKPLSRW